MKSKYYTEWVKNDSTTSKRYDSTTSIFRYDLNTPINWNKTFDIKTNIDSRTVDLINQVQEAYLVPNCLLKELELPNHNKTFSERFRVFYGKDTYALVDTEKGLLAKVKKNKELINDIEIAVLYLILKGFLGYKTSRINKLISAMDKPIKGCLYELIDQYYCQNDLHYICTAVPRSSRRMVKCLVDNAECNSKDNNECILNKIVDKLKTKQEGKPKPSVFKDGEERPKLPEGFTYLDDDVKDYIFSQPKVSWEDDWGEEIITKYLNEVMKK